MQVGPRKMGLATECKVDVWNHPVLAENIAPVWGPGSGSGAIFSANPGWNKGWGKKTSTKLVLLHPRLAEIPAPDASQKMMSKAWDFQGISHSLRCYQSAIGHSMVCCVTSWDQSGAGTQLGYSDSNSHKLSAVDSLNDTGVLCKIAWIMMMIQELCQYGFDFTF